MAGLGVHYLLWNRDGEFCFSIKRPYQGSTNDHMSTKAGAQPHDPPCTYSVILKVATDTKILDLRTRYITK